MNGELFVKVSQREERADRIKAFLIFPVAAFHLAIMSGSVRANQFMLDTQLSGGFLEKGLNIPFAVGKGGRSLHLPGFFLPDGSSAGKAVAYKFFSSSPVGTFPVCA